MINITKNFKFEGTLINTFRYGQGHINETHVVVYKLDNFKYRRYLLQKINSNVFNDVEGLMKNIKRVTEFAHQSIINEGGNPFTESLTLIPTIDNKDYYVTSNNEYWRAYIFVEEGLGYEMVNDNELFYQSGIAFGKFQKLLSNFDANTLSEPIKDFHHTKVRLDHLKEAIKNNIAKRKDLVKDEIEFYLNRYEYASKITTLLESGKMPYRVTHNDTKLNNVLINPITKKAQCVIDLDTIMKGSIIYDFGDSIRFGANDNLEDEKDLTKVNFNIEKYKTFSLGFINEVKSVLHPLEIENMAFGAILMTYECGMRFLTDYLNGDTYFRTKYPDQNLDRTRTQMKLVVDMEKALPQMNEIITNIINK